MLVLKLLNKLLTNYMMKKTCLIILSLCSFSLFGAEDFVGEYVGKFSGFERQKHLNQDTAFAQISRHANGYKLRITEEPLKRAIDVALLTGLKDKDGEIEIPASGSWRCKGKITKDAMDFDVRIGNEEGKLKFERFERKSPTLLQSAPKGASVLFDGKNTKQWLNAKDKTPCHWKLTKDGSMIVTRPEGEKASKDIISKDGFENIKLHLEFKLPNMWEKTSQERANSGVFIGPYEIQVLDSFGFDGAWNDCGAIYRISPPQVNASLPPEVWQTYDIVFTAPKFDGDKLTALPKISVWLNGVRVQYELEIPYGTSGALRDKDKFKHPKPPYNIKLQDHGNPVEFRNIWVENL